MIEEKKSIENKSALELSKKMLNYNICKTNGQFFIWVLSIGFLIYKERV